MRALLLAAALAAAIPGLAQDADRIQRGIASIEALLAKRPDDATLYFYLAKLRAEAADAKACVEALAKVNQLGDGFLPARQLGFEKVWGDPAFQSLRSRMEARLPRLDYAPIEVQLEDNGLLPEGMAYDAPSRSFFVGSTAEHKVVRVSAEGVAADFTNPTAELDPVLGIAVDSPRRKLYAVTTSTLTAEGRKHRRNAVVVFDVDSGAYLRRVDIAEAQGLNDVAVAAGGRAFTTDSGAGAVYELTQGTTAKQLVAPGTLPGANGLAASPDAKKLYVAHNTGLAVVNLDSGQVKRVNNTTRETVAAIDGLYEWHGQLVGVQNATTPGRVILMSLSSDGETITKVQTLLSHHHNALDEPTTGAPTERGFFLLAATGLAHYNDNGTIDDPGTVPKPTILRVLLAR
ncbi:MAG TPA: hypothetical protein VLT89_07735 [Usitatibacter sp.]|nr:hypothetical protein [Usitatibacter sp.]